MKRLSSKKITILSGIIAIMLSTQTFADSKDTELLQQIANRTNQLVADAVQKWGLIVNLIYTKTPDVEKTISANESITQKDKPILPQSEADKLSSDIDNALLMTNATRLSELAAIAGKDFLNSDQQGPMSNILNFNTLLSPSGYVIPTKAYMPTGITASAPEPTKTPASLYIQYLSQGSSLPKNLLDLQGASQSKLQSLRNNPNFMQYVVGIRSYVANQSLGMSNLYAIYNRHKPDPDLGGKIGLHNQSLSIADAEDYLAKRRIADKQWFKNMEAASPVTVLREILYVLAEIRYEMHQSRNDSERMLATLTALELQSLTQRQTQLEILKQNLTMNR